MKKSYQNFIFLFFNIHGFIEKTNKLTLYLLWMIENNAKTPKNKKAKIKMIVTEFSVLNITNKTANIRHNGRTLAMIIVEHQ